MNINLSDYYSRGEDQIAAGYQQLLFRASRGAQSAEVNEVQEMTHDRIRRVAETMWRDGAVIEGEIPMVNAETGEVQCFPSKVYIRGQVWDVPGRVLMVPTEGVVQIGVALNFAIVTEVEDPTLLDPATATRNYNQPGAARYKADPQWATDGDPFYVVYTIEDGRLKLPQTPDSPFYELLARYDRESEGSYKVAGLEVSALGVDGRFLVSSGVGNVFGYKVDAYTDIPVAFPIDPDLADVVSEPDTYVDSSTPVQLSRSPVDAITSVVSVEERTVTLTRGGSAGGADSLPDSSITAIISVTQGATTYGQTADWLLTNDRVDWAPDGGEPAAGSSYDVTYRYYRSFTPQNVDLEAGTFTITGAVADQAVLTDYSWRVPRLDRICMDRNGAIRRLKGVASRYQLAPPPVPATMLLLATVYQQWSYAAPPGLVHDGPRAAGMLNQNRLEEMVIDLADVVSRERLRWDVSDRFPTSKRGVFVDPMLDDDMRDLGIAQDGVIQGGALELPITSEVLPVAQSNQMWMLPFSETAVVEQTMETATTLINPYLVVDPVPGTLALDPAADFWPETVSTTAEGETIVIPRLGFFRAIWHVTRLSGELPAETSTIDRTRTFFRRWLGRTVITRESNVNTRTVSEFLRQIEITFTIEGFRPGEELVNLTFDGIDVTPAGPLAANGSGALTGTFTVPANVPVGTKAVIATGSNTTIAESTFAGGSTEGGSTEDGGGGGTSRWRPWWWWWAFWPWARYRDPVAQTFRLAESRWITSVDVAFRAKGSPDYGVRVQIRETDNGVPAGPVLAEGRVDGSFATTGWTRITLVKPFWATADVEYSFTLLTDDPEHAVALAELGQFDETANQYVTVNPNVAGVLLKSSNNSTWTAFQTQDLMFRINAAEFVSTELTVDYGPVHRLVATGITQSGGTAVVTAPGHGFVDGETVIIAGADQAAYNGAFQVSNATADTFEVTVDSGAVTPATGTIGLAPGRTSDLVALAGVELPTSASSVVFRFVVADAGGTGYDCSPNEPLEIDRRIEHGLRLYADLSGTVTESPLIVPGVNVVMGNLQETATYVSRAISCVNTDRIEINYDALIPTSAGVAVSMQEGAPDSPSWSSAIPINKLESTGDGWGDYNHSVDPFTNGGTETRVKLTLTGTPAARPALSQLRVAALFTGG